MGHFSVFDERGDFGKMEPIPKVVLEKEEKEEIQNVSMEEEVEEEEEEEKVEGEEQEEVEEEEEREEEEEEAVDDSTEYISLKTLQENRISSDEITAMNQFKNYTRGERTNRLYIKNLAKQVVESDLRFIFNRFHGKGKEKREELEIRLMQEGRMKGQAFVTFPNETIAETALDAVHGYVLHEKPMVIQFGR